MNETQSDLLLSVRSHPRCLEHRPGLGHPESPDRIQVALDAVSARVEGRWVVDRESPLPAEKDVIGVLPWIHDPAYIDRIREAMIDVAAGESDQKMHIYGELLRSMFADQFPTRKV